MTPQGYIPPAAPAGAREGADLHIGAIVRAGIVFAVMILMIILTLLAWMRHLDYAYGKRTSEAAPQVTDADLPPLPRLQTAPLEDLLAVRAAEELHLDRYLWVDRAQGIAQIPIDRAIVLWVKMNRQSAATPAPIGPPTPGTNDGTSASHQSQIPMTELQVRQSKKQKVEHAP